MTRPHLLINMRLSIILLLISLTFIGLIQCNSTKQISEASLFPPTWTVFQKEVFGVYQYQFGYASSTDGYEEFSFYILHNNEIITHQSASKHTAIVSVNEQNFMTDSFAPPQLVDLNNDGNDELIVQVYSGGAHCCYEYWIYSLGETLLQIDYLHTMDSPLLFEDIDENGIYEAKGIDKSYAYWETDYANSPSPQIILTFTVDGLKLDIEKMRKPAPSAANLQNTIMRVRSELGRTISPDHNDAWRHAGIPTAMWANMLELIYSGNGDTAWDFFDRVWRKGVSGKEEFRTAFNQVLQSSPYWDGIRELNGW